MARAICQFGETDIPSSRIRYSKLCEIILITILRLRYAYGFYRSSITFIEFRNSALPGVIGFTFNLFEFEYTEYR